MYSWVCNRNYIHDLSLQICMSTIFPIPVRCNSYYISLFRPKALESSPTLLLSPSDSSDPSVNSKALKFKIYPESDYYYIGLSYYCLSPGLFL